MNLKKENYLSLLIISNNAFANGYKLCGILSRLFGLINCSELIKSLKNQDFVIVDKVEYGVSYFSISNKGHAFLKENKQLIEELKVDFPQENEFIANLVSNYKDL